MFLPFSVVLSIILRQKIAPLQTYVVRLNSKEKSN